MNYLHIFDFVDYFTSFGHTFELHSTFNLKIDLRFVLLASFERFHHFVVSMIHPAFLHSREVELWQRYVLNRPQFNINGLSLFDRRDLDLFALNLDKGQHKEETN